MKIFHEKKFKRFKVCLIDIVTPFKPMCGLNKPRS